MRPILIQIGALGLPAYGFLLVISFLIAILLVKHAARKYSIAGPIIENLAFYVMLGVIIGGRLLYVIFHWPQYENDLLGIVRIWEGGMMLFGGFIGGFIAGLLYIKKEKLPILKLSDLVAPSIALGEFFTRIGCFLNGCCFGIPSQLPWAVKFPTDCIAGSSPIGDQHLHPTQLYTSLFSLMLFFFLNRLLYKSHKRGSLFGIYLIFSAGFRFGVDHIRYYENSANFLVNQIISIGLVMLGIIILIRKNSVQD